MLSTLESSNERELSNWMQRRSAEREAKLAELEREVKLRESRLRRREAELRTWELRLRSMQSEVGNAADRQADADFRSSFGLDASSGQGQPSGDANDEAWISYSGPRRGAVVTQVVTVRRGGPRTNHWLSLYIPPKVKPTLVAL